MPLSQKRLHPWRRFEDFLLPTELIISKFNSSIKFTYDNGGLVEFYSDGFEFIPPSTPLLLNYLEQASHEMNNTDFTLKIVGASSNGDFVEIIVPDSTSDPIQSASSSVSWDFANLEKLEEVSFQVRQQEPSDPEPEEPEGLM